MNHPSSSMSSDDELRDGASSGDDYSFRLSQDDEEGEADANNNNNPRNDGIFFSVDMEAADNHAAAAAAAGMNHNNHHNNNHSTDAPLPSFRMTKHDREYSLRVSFMTEPHNEEPLAVIVPDTMASSLDDHDTTTTVTLIQTTCTNLRLALQQGNAVCILLATSAAAFITYALIQLGEGVHPHVAALVVIFFGGTVAPPLVTAVACGALLGGNGAIAAPFWMGPTTALTAVLWYAAHRNKWMLGYSGRVGVVAMLAFTLATIALMAPAGHIPWRQFGSTYAMWRARVHRPVIMAASLVGVSTASAVLRLHTHAATAHPVVTPVAVALGLVLFLNGLEGYKTREAMYEGALIGALLAMGSVAKLPTVTAFVWSSVWAAGWQIFLTPFFLGFPKEGMVALLGYLTYAHVTWQNVTRLLATLRHLREQAQHRQAAMAAAAEQEKGLAITAYHDAPTQQRQQQEQHGENGQPRIAMTNDHEHTPYQDDTGNWQGDDSAANMYEEEFIQPYITEEKGTNESMEERLFL